MRDNVTYALFGGSFDPPHLGHKEIVKELLKLKIVDRVLIVPTYLNPFKSSFNISAKKRLELVKNTLNLENVIISSFEIEQQRAVYTVETFKELSKKYNIKYIVIGADNLESLTKWREFNYLNTQVTWIVATRDNIELDCSKLKKCIELPIRINVSSSEIRGGKKLEFLDEKIKFQVLKEYNLKKI